jgi:hypothetical protein
MAGVTLSTDDIKTTPPKVRHWLERQVVRVSEPASTPNAAICLPPAPVQAEVGMNQEGKSRRKCSHPPHD